MSLDASAAGAATVPAGVRRAAAGGNDAAGASSAEPRAETRREALVIETVRLRIEGRVQGVGFRAFVEREATALGLDGWVRNRRDGGVEAVVSGPADAVRELVRRCRIGPTAARVDMLRELAEDTRPPKGFTVTATQ